MAFARGSSLATGGNLVARQGDVIRALEWLGPAEVEDGLVALLPTLSEADRHELAAIAIPATTTTTTGWLAQPVAALPKTGSFFASYAQRVETTWRDARTDLHH